MPVEPHTSFASLLAAAIHRPALLPAASVLTVPVISPSTVTTYPSHHLPLSPPAPAPLTTYQAGQRLRSHVIIEPNLNRGHLRRLDAEGLFQAQ